MVGEGSFPCTSNVFFSIDANLPSMLSRVGRSGQVQRSKDEGAAPVCGNKHLGVYHAERALSVALKAEGRNAFRWMGTVSCTLVDIRPAREEDAPALARLYVEAFGSKLRWAFGKYEDALPAVVEQLLRHDQMRWSETLVAEVDGQVAGMAVLRRDHTHRPRWNLVWHLTRRHVRGWRVFTATFIMTAMCNNLCTPTRSYLESLAVDARYRGQGIGTLLLERCFEESRRAGKREISLHVVDTNPRAKQLYERMGFRTVRIERFGRIAARWMGFSAQDFMVRPL